MGSVSMLDDRPDIFPHLWFEWEAFNELDRSRTSGFNGPNPIPLLEIDVWCRMHNVEGDAALDLVHMIRGLDATYLSHARERK